MGVGRIFTGVESPPHHHRRTHRRPLPIGGRPRPWYDNLFLPAEAADAIADELRARGHRVKKTPTGDLPDWGRYVYGTGENVYGTGEITPHLRAVAEDE